MQHRQPFSRRVNGFAAATFTVALRGGTEVTR